jgi:Ca2+-binding RTX toxin-like protein
MRRAGAGLRRISRQHLGREESVMANVIHSVGQPAFDWQALLDAVLNNGTLSNIGGGPQALITLTFGTTVLEISGVGLTVGAARQLTAGTITGFVLKSGATTVLTQNAFVAAPTFTAFNTLLANNNNANFDAVFAKEGLNVTGSAAAFESLGTSRFNDTVNGNAGDDFIEGNAGVDTFNGGADYDTLGFHGKLGGFGTGVTVTMNIAGVAGGGKVTGTLPSGAVNTTFSNMERAVGTEGNDTFISGAGFLPTFDNNFDWVGGDGADRFTDNGDNDIQLNYDAEKFEHPGDGIWGNAAGEFGVIVNVSAASITANVGNGSKTVSAGRAIDTFGDTDTIAGIRDFKLTDAADYFAASDAGGRARGRAGNDTLNGGAGQDRLQGDEGNDTINGGDGRDDISGWTGNDTINAGAGEFDFIEGSSGTDTVNGDVGFDDYDFNGGNFTTAGNAVNVILNNTGPGRGTVTGSFEGAAVNTTFQNLERIGGTLGNDTFTANAGFTNTEDARRAFYDLRGATLFFEFVGYGGADTFTDNSGLAGGVTAVNYDDEKFGFANYDGHTWGTLAGEFGVIINLSAASISANVGRGVEVVAANRARDIFLATDIVNGVKVFIGTDDIDYFAAGAAGAYFEGRLGNDTAVGGLGSDEIYGEDGNDNITGGGGIDYLYGESGNDVVRGGDGADNIFGDDGIDALFGDAGNDNIRAGSDNDTLNGDLGNDRLRGQDGDDTINGGAGNDIMEGNSGNDTLNGGTEQDILYGDDGNDSLNGSSGADEMYGWVGNDTYFVDNIGDVVFEDPGNGLDIVDSRVTYSLVNRGEVENMTLSGAGAISGTGNGLANILTGNAAANGLNGLAGNDKLIGGLGADTLTSGLGNDQLEYNALGQGGDIVTDYANVAGNNDTFRFLGSAFGGHAPGYITAAEFQSSTADTAGSASVRVLFETDTGILRYDADGSGAGAAEIIATVQAGVVLGLSDILFF